MSQLSQSELTKVRKLADVSVTLKNEMKQSVIDEKFRTLNASVKKLLMKKGITLEIIVMKEIE
jgi:macrodomain Ter protein organizer (MatP/YcbG family)